MNKSCVFWRGSQAIRIISNSWATLEIRPSQSVDPCASSNTAGDLAGIANAVHEEYLVIYKIHCKPYSKYKRLSKIRKVQNVRAVSFLNPYSKDIYRLTLPLSKYRSMKQHPR